MSKLKCVFSGPIGGDCCSTNIYEPSEPMTVQQLCDDIIAAKGEWGEIDIYNCPNQNVDYFHGQYVDRNRNPIGDFKFPPEIANAKIIKIRWHGGWSYAHYTIYI